MGHGKGMNITTDRHGSNFIQRTNKCELSQRCMEWQIVYGMLGREHRGRLNKEGRTEGRVAWQ